MVVVEFNGGLGNQMFEYAAARTIASIKGLRLKLHVESLARTGPDVTLREFELDIFKNIYKVSDIALASEVAICDSYLQSSFYKIYNRARKIIGLSPAFTYHTDKYSITTPPHIANLKGDIIYIAGLWQNESWFLPIASLIRYEFEFPNIEDSANISYAHQIQSSNSIAIHVRRGDYLTEKNFVNVSHVCSIDYYEDAISYIGKQVANPTFYVFSDEMDWVTQNIHIPYPVVFINNNHGKKSYIDMHLMSLCKHNIIANSTFSWWGAWLNKNEDKIVIAPKQWLPNVGVYAKHLIPDSWISI